MTGLGGGYFSGRNTLIFAHQRVLTENDDDSANFDATALSNPPVLQSNLYYLLEFALSNIQTFLSQEEAEILRSFTCTYRDKSVSVQSIIKRNVWFRSPSTEEDPTTLATTLQSIDSDTLFVELGMAPLHTHSSPMKALTIFLQRISWS